MEKPDITQKKEGTQQETGEAKETPKDSKSMKRGAIKDNVQKLKWGELKDWQKKRLGYSVVIFLGVMLTVLVIACAVIYTDKAGEDQYWDSYFQTDEDVQAAVDEISGSAVKVSTGVYVDNFKSISLKDNSFTAQYLIWFRWQGSPDLDMADNFRIYKGTINKKELVKDYHQGNENYQLVRVDATVSKAFWTVRFPLESHQLRVYIESNYPANRVVFVEDTPADVNGNTGVTGYDMTRIGSAVVGYEYDQTHGDPEMNGSVPVTEYMVQMEFNRDGFGTFLMCFIAMFGTSLWVFITLYINTYHRVDPLAMIPAALFGTVSNIMVGANMLPGTVGLGLLVFLNLWGILTILAVTMTIININRIRNRFEDRSFAGYYGRTMLRLMGTVVLLGDILMPLLAYKF